MNQEFSQSYADGGKTQTNNARTFCPGNEKISKASVIHVGNILDQDIQTMKCHCSRFFHEHHTDTALLTATKLAHSGLK